MQVGVFKNLKKLINVLEQKERALGVWEVMKNIWDSSNS
jgi:hypothetical protein